MTRLKVRARLLVALYLLALVSYAEERISE